MAQVEYFIQMDAGTGQPADVDLLYIAVRDNNVFAEYDNKNKKWQMCPPYEKDRGEGINAAGSLYWQQTSDAPSMTKKREPTGSKEVTLGQRESKIPEANPTSYESLPIEELIKIKLLVEKEIAKRLESDNIKELLKVISNGI